MKKQSQMNKSSEDSAFIFEFYWDINESLRSYKGFISQSQMVGILP